MLIEIFSQNHNFELYRLMLQNRLAMTPTLRKNKQREHRNLSHGQVAFHLLYSSSSRRSKSFPSKIGVGGKDVFGTFPSKALFNHIQHDQLVLNWILLYSVRMSPITPYMNQMLIDIPSSLPLKITAICCSGIYFSGTRGLRMFPVESAFPFSAVSLPGRVMWQGYYALTSLSGPASRHF